MTQQQTFRSALNGFHREDVVNYIEYLKSVHTAEINQLHSELEFLRNREPEAEQNSENAEQSDVIQSQASRIRELFDYCSELEAKLVTAEEARAYAEQKLAYVEDAKAAAEAKLAEAEEAKAAAEAAKAQAEAKLAEAEAKVCEEIKPVPVAVPVVEPKAPVDGNLEEKLAVAEAAKAYAEQKLAAAEEAKASVEQKLAAAEAAKAYAEDKQAAAEAAKVQAEAKLAAAEAAKVHAEEKLAAVVTMHNSYDSRASQELETYRRAERIERKAKERAAQVYQQSNGALVEANIRVEDAAVQIAQLSDMVMEQIRYIQNAVSGTKQAMRDASQIMYTIRPEEER